MAALKRVEANLRRYKASVLKAACEGRLTAAWRAAHPEVEPASELLKRILRDRRRRWEESELTKLRAKGKPPKDDRWKERYQEPVVPTDNGSPPLPPLPGKWTWATLDQIACLTGGITKGQKRDRGTQLESVPYLRVANVQRGFLDLAEMKEIEATPEEIEELRLQPGDVLFTEGGDRDKLGRGWVWQGELPCCIHQNHIFRARMLDASFQARLVSWWGNSFGALWFQKTGKQTTNLASINLTVLRSFPVPLPPVAEQALIVDAVEDALSILEAGETAVNLSLRRASKLRQSILRDAFEGKLVEQDPHDEPASVLLERIRTARPRSQAAKLGAPRPPGQQRAANRAKGSLTGG